MFISQVWWCKSAILFKQSVCFTLCDITHVDVKHYIFPGNAQIGTSTMDNALLRYGAKEYFFRAALCRMCQDLQDGANAVTKYEEMLPAFADSRECKLLKVRSRGCSCWWAFHFMANADDFYTVPTKLNSVMQWSIVYVLVLLRFFKSNRYIAIFFQESKSRFFLPKNCRFHIFTL